MRYLAAMTRVVSTFADGVCTAVLTEPEKLNPLGDETRRDLRELVRRLEDDEETRVVVLAGAGRAFSAGADLRGPRFTADAAAPQRSWSSRRREAGAWQRLLDDWEQLPQITVARLHGVVLGGGLVLAAACDLRIAADDLVIGLPEVSVGLPLTQAGVVRLIREIGLPRTRDLVLSGRRLDGKTAVEWGLATRLVTRADLDSAVAVLVADLVGMPDAPLRLMKDALYAVGRDHPSQSLAWADADLITWAGSEPESREATVRYKARRLGRSSPDA
jgi:enoyl-CoA hydratase/carnithine racemase